MFFASRIFSIYISLVCLISSSEQLTINDHMCKINQGILCVKDEFRGIKNVAEDVVRKALEIERYIKQTKAINKLIHYVDAEMEHIRASLPSSHYHDHLSQQNNIDREYLMKLLSEAHNALIYFSNSIDDLRQLGSLYAQEIDNHFKALQTNLKYDMVCRYRNILNVYSKPWKSVYELNDGMKFSERMDQISSSENHDIRSIVIAEYLRKWMGRLSLVIDNLEIKYIS